MSNNVIVFHASMCLTLEAAKERSRISNMLFTFLVSPQSKGK